MTFERPGGAGASGRVTVARRDLGADGVATDLAGDGDDGVFPTFELLGLRTSGIAALAESGGMSASRSPEVKTGIGAIGGMPAFPEAHDAVFGKAEASTASAGAASGFLGADGMGSGLTLCSVSFAACRLIGSAGWR